MDAKATEIFSEGLIIPGVKLFDKGDIVESVVDTSKANSRLPDFLEGDLLAGVASVKLGKERVQ